MKHKEDQNLKEQLQMLIMQEQYQEADRVLQDYLSKGGCYDDVLAIYDASIGQSLGDHKRTFVAIYRGLYLNPENYELYVMLGNDCLGEHPEQSYLCYEHALACCLDPEDRLQIQQMLSQLSENGITVGRTAAVIWCHGSLEMVKTGVESVQKISNIYSSIQIVAVPFPCTEEVQAWLQKQPDLILAEMDHTKQDASKIWEQGIAAAWADADCLLMDSDSILPKHALFWLRMALYGSDAIGTAGSMSKHVTNSRLSDKVKTASTSEGLAKLARTCNVPMRYPCETIPWTKGAAVLIRRQVLSQIGTPRENFTDAVFLDRAYGQNVEQAGYRNVLCENSFLLCQEEKAAERPLSGKNTVKRKFLLFYAGNEKGYYQDTKYFTSEIAKELKRRGHQTFICDLARGSHDAAALENYLMNGVDAVLTFNGEAIEKQEWWQLWNQLGACVVNILMDPPFHLDLCPYLEHPDLERYLLLCPDDNHVTYVKRYFPQVKHVEFMPHAGTPLEREPIPWKEKRLDLLFSGTYTNPQAFLDTMKQTLPPDEFQIYAGMGERILQHPSLSVEQAAEEALYSDSVVPTPSRIQRATTGMSLLDGWVRMVMRERVVTTLVEGGVDLYVLGDGWQNCPCAGNPHLHSLSKERIPLADTLAWMEDARICLNIMPWFKAGSHDRVFNAMLRGSIALTDPSSYFQKHFQDETSILYYSLEDLPKLPEMVRHLLAHPSQAEAIAQSGYRQAEAFTWEHYVEDLLTKVEYLF